MASKVLSATRQSDGYHIVVLLDVEKVSLADDLQAGVLAGTPDPAWVKEWVWGLPQPSPLPLHENGGHEESGAFLHAAHVQHGQDLGEKEYLENILAMLPEMIALEVAQRTPPAALEVIDLLHGKEIG